MRERRTRARRERGAVAVEAAIVLTVIVIPLTFTVISWAYMFSFRQALSQAASEGARAAVGAPTATAGVDAATAAINNALDTYGVDCSDGLLTCTVTPTSGTTPCTDDATHNCVTVQVTYPYRDHALLPKIPFTGWTLPPDLTFTSVVEVS